MPVSMLLSAKKANKLEIGSGTFGIMEVQVYVNGKERHKWQHTNF
jgi:hypothetical protein